jgi:hypothetical protein
MMDEVKQELYKYEEAPTILVLDNEEKFKDKDGNIIEIEVRGERKYNKCYFKVKDVSNGFGMPNLNTTLLHKENTYEKNIDYKSFTVKNLDNVLKVSSKIYLFLTFTGFQKLINVSRQKFDNNLIFTMSKWLQQFDYSRLKKYNIPNMSEEYRPKLGYVYCVTSKILNAIKIGFWTGQICNLRKRYITTYGNDIELYTFYTNKPHKLESMCHKYFELYKITNELFQKEYLKNYLNYLELNKITPTQIQMENTNNNIFLEYDHNIIETINNLKKQLMEEQKKSLIKDKEIELLNNKLNSQHVVSFIDTLNMNSELINT